MYQTSDKISSVFAVSVMQLSQADIVNCAGLSSIRVTGQWTALSASEIQFQEKEVADGVEVDLKIKITNTSVVMQDLLTSLSNKYVVCRLHTTNCLDRVVGTDDCPVTFAVERSGTPSHFILRYKGIQPEFAKLLQSF